MRDLLVICDTESMYARRLSEYISRKEREHYEVRNFTSVNLMINSLESETIAILVIDENSYMELVHLDYKKHINVGSIRILKGNRDEMGFMEGEGIYKYQSARDIFKFITGNLKEDLGNNISKRPLREIKLGVKKNVQEKLLVKGMISDDETLKLIGESIDEVELEIGEERLSEKEKHSLLTGVFYAIRGLDVLEELISDESITEIMVNGENNIFYEKNGQLINSGKAFDSREMLIDIIRKIVADANRTVNMSSPIVDARLKDGSRINAVLEPVSLEGPILTIRRFPREPLSAGKLIEMGAVSDEIMEVLRKLVCSGYNILVSGSTGAGKTTFLNILSGFIPKDERIITIEDSAELKLMGIDNLVRLEARNANSDGSGEISIRDLIKSALRMRPDRIIVGETRGAEAIDMLQSFLVGQDGSMSTIHANSAEDALYRLEMLVMINSQDIPLGALRRQIATGVDIIVQLGRLKDKSRKLLEIREVRGYKEGEITTGLMYKYEDGKFMKHDDLVNTYKLEMAGYSM